MTDIAAPDAWARRASAEVPGWSRLLWGLAVILLLCQAPIWYRPQRPAWRSYPACGQVAGLALRGLADVGAAALTARRARRVLTVTLCPGRSSPIRQGGRRHRSHAAEGSCRPIYFTWRRARTDDGDADGRRRRHRRHGQGRAGWRRALAPLIPEYACRVDYFDLDAVSGHAVVPTADHEPFAAGSGARRRSSSTASLMCNGRQITILPGTCLTAGAHQ